jgi:hypothetical protein
MTKKKSASQQEIPTGQDSDAVIQLSVVAPVYLVREEIQCVILA